MTDDEGRGNEDGQMTKKVSGENLSQGLIPMDWIGTWCLLNSVSATDHSAQLVIDLKWRFPGMAF